MNTVPPSPTRADLARELLLYKMKEYSEDFACATWLVGLEFQLWHYGNIASTDSKEQYSIKLGKELRILAEVTGGWWAWNNEVPAGGENPVFMAMDRWLQVLIERNKSSLP
jgi:hypothetical protein